MSRNCHGCAHLLSRDTAHVCTTAKGDRHLAWRNTHKPFGEMPATDAPPCPAFAAKDGPND